ncbi:FixH family protein [Marinobacterium jannaschii]|uniref:FixH family protein n=1 Tax=Marinobacterium jannaschii TaxID=64970 RepID=UPI000485CD81|nr:FixH family protein [Marinobacterium jannaschii]
MSNSNTPVAPWYKQPWLWFILTPLIAVFIYGFVFLYLSITTMDGIVKEDHYKVARGITKDDSLELAAAELSLTSELKLDNLTGDLMLDLKGNLASYPASLNLDLVHPTHQKYDQKITLKLVPGSRFYSGTLQSQLKGKRYLLLYPAQNEWRIRGEISPPYDQSSFTINAN